MTVLKSFKHCPFRSQSHHVGNPLEMYLSSYVLRKKIVADSGVNKILETFYPLEVILLPPDVSRCLTYMSAGSGTVSALP